MQSLIAKYSFLKATYGVSSIFSALQVAHFSKFISKSRTKRMPLTTKRAGKGFYKGTGSRKEGVISSTGTFYFFI